MGPGGVSTSVSRKPASRESIGQTGAGGGRVSHVCPRYDQLGAEPGEERTGRAIGAADWAIATGWTGARGKAGTKSFKDGNERHKRPFRLRCRRPEVRAPQVQGALWSAIQHRAPATSRALAQQAYPRAGRGVWCAPRHWSSCCRFPRPVSPRSPPDCTALIDKSPRPASGGFARCGPQANRSILLTGHMDTGCFPPITHSSHQRWLDDATLNGPGVADMKGGIAVMLHALLAF